MRARAWWSRCGPGVTSAEAGRPCHPALHARMPGMPVLPEPQDQPLHRDPRHAGPGPDAGRDHAVLDAGWHADPSLHGLLDLRQPHGAAGDRAGQGARGRALRQDLLHRLRRHHRHRRGDQHRQGRDRRQGRGVRAGRHRAERDPGPAAGRGRHDHRRRPQQRPQGLGRALRDDAFRQPEGDRRPGRAAHRQPDQDALRPDRRGGLLLRLHRQRAR